MITSNLGCHILSVFTKDRDGNYGDVVLGYQDVEDCHKDDKFLGCIIGRCKQNCKWRVSVEWKDL